MLQDVIRLLYLRVDQLELCRLEGWSAAVFVEQGVVGQCLKVIVMRLNSHGSQSVERRDDLISGMVQNPVSYGLPSTPPLKGLIERLLQALAFMGAFGEWRRSTYGTIGLWYWRSTGHGKPNHGQWSAPSSRGQDRLCYEGTDVLPEDRV